MIELGNGLVNVLYSDGTSAIFDPEELRIRIGKSLSAAGFGDVWIAHEIVLAVEYALRCRQSGDLGSVIQASEVDDCVARVLDDSGYAAASPHFYQLSRTSGDFGKLSPEKVEEYLTEKLDLALDAASDLTGKVNDALLQLKIRRCSPHLVLELARYFREEEARSSRAVFVPEQKKVSDQKEPQSEVAPVEEAPRHDEWKIRLSESIFPSVRAQISLDILFGKCELTPPLTELSLVPLLLKITEQIDREYLCLTRGKEGNYPLLLTLRNFQDFSRKYLCWGEDEEDKVLQNRRTADFVDLVRSLLLVKPFKIFVR